MNLILLAIAPGIAICLFIFYRDAFNKEPRLNLVFTFILGAATVYPAALIENAIIDPGQNSILQMAIRAFFLVALVEEGLKFAVVRLYAYPRKSFDEPLDGIVYCVMASMGFATLENLLYVLNEAQRNNGFQTAFLRMFTAVPGHATFAILMGYYAGKAKFDPARSVSWLLKGLAWAIFFHGTYDYCLFLQQSPEVDPDLANGALFVGAVISLIIGLRLSFNHIRTHRRLSQQTYQPARNFLLRGAVPADIPLIRELTYKIWPQTYAGILSKEQIDYMLEMMYSESALSQQMRDNNEFVILYDGQEPIGFASISQTGATTFKLHKIYVLPNQQGHGAGRFIIDQMLRAISTRGATSLQLNVNRQNNAKLFYEKLGFSVIGQEDIDIGHGYFMNDYIMEKKLG
jgi:RsiW-degrading membrane proteinase PrsW (M82 family)/ribosomal protein S18 acetylase RimI-like enzyme